MTAISAVIISSTSNHPSIQRLDDLIGGILGQSSDFLGQMVIFWAQPQQGLKPWF
jgi:hypothetical protein